MFWISAAPWWLARGVAPAPAPAGLTLAVGAVVLVPAGLAMAALPRDQLLMGLGLIWIADTGAYLAGRAFGRRKLAPSISPGKTWEGVAGGAAGCIIYAIIWAFSDPELRARVQGLIWIPYLAGVLLLCALSVVGDLFESALKRRAGAKDSGTLLPGHGGVLDRIDSATATLPGRAFADAGDRRHMTQGLTLLGATGSIGASTLDVVARHPDRYRVFALTAHRAADALLGLCAPARAALRGALRNAPRTPACAGASPTPAAELLFGPQALEQVAADPECDVVMAAIVGAAGLAPTLAAARAGKRVLLANKEALVMAGPFFIARGRANAARRCCRSTASTTRCSSACRRRRARRRCAACDAFC